MPMSIKDIARLTGLSTATVSHAINGTRAVSAKSRQLVADATQKTGYKPSSAAKMLRTKKSRIIGLIVPSTEPNNHTNSFYLDVITGVRNTLQANGYEMIVAMYSEEDIELRLAGLSMIQRRLVDGILLVPFSRESCSAANIVQVGVPLVLLDRRLDDSTLPVVESDNQQATMQAIQLLIRAGKKRIAYLGGKMSFSTLGDRYLGYCQAFSQNSLPVDPALVQLELPDTIDEGARRARELIGQGADAVFTDRNMLMIGVVEYCQNHSVRIPADLGLISFDDYSWMSITNPPITAVRQNAALIGEKGAEILVRQIEHPESPAELVRIIVPARLIIRKSHGPESGSGKGEYYESP
jgi:LacI family transcriptional regulator